MRHSDGLTQLLAWYTAVNIGMYLISVFVVLTVRDVLVRWVARWFGLAEDVVLRAAFHWLIAYKLAIILFALGPWLTLLLIT